MKWCWKLAHETFLKLKKKPFVAFWGWDFLTFSRSYYTFTIWWINQLSQVNEKLVVKRQNIQYGRQKFLLFHIMLCCGYEFLLKAWFLWGGDLIWLVPCAWCRRGVSPSCTPQSRALCLRLWHLIASCWRRGQRWSFQPVSRFRYIVFAVD